MATQVQRRRGTTTEHASFTGAEGELTVDTTKDTVVVHDGATAGGQPLAREDLDNVSSTDVTAKVAAATTSAAGKVQLEDSTTSTSTTTAATPNSVKAAKDAADAAQTTADNALASSGGTITGPLTIGTDGSLTFEGSTTDDFETTLAITDPTADRTITLPDINGTLVTTGDTGTVTSTMIADGTIADGDISASAEIAVSKLADGAARQLLQTDAAGTGVEWTNNVDVPGTLDVTGNATFDANVTVQGDLTVNGTTTTIDTETLLVKDKNIEMGVVDTPTDITADGGGITLKGTTDKTINWVDSTDSWTSSENIDLASTKTYKIAGTDVLSATALGSNVQISSANIPDGTVTNADLAGSIADSKLNTISTAGKVSNSATTATDANTGSAIVARDASGNFSAGTITADLSGNASTVTTNANLTGDVTSVGNATSIAAGVIVDGDVNAAAAIAGTKISPNFGTQTVQTTGSLLVGPTTSRNNSFGNAAIAQLETTGATAALQITRNSFGADSPILSFGKTRAETLNGVTIVSDGDQLGAVNFEGADGDALVLGAQVRAEVDGTPGENQMPGRIVFSTNPGTASAAPAERLRITASGEFEFTGAGTAGTSQAVYFSGSAPVDSLVIDSSGRLLVGTASSTVAFRAIFQGNSAGNDPGVICIAFDDNAPADGAILGALDFSDSSHVRAARIECNRDGGTWTSGSTGSQPTRLVFRTTADGASSPTERMKITSAGSVQPLYGIGGGGVDHMYYGPVTSISIDNGGSGYTDGTYTDVVLETAGFLRGVAADFTVSSGVITTCTVAREGRADASAVGDALTLNDTNALGPGTGLSLSVGSIRAAQISWFGEDPAPRVRLYNSDVSNVGGQELGSILFSARDSANGYEGAGDLARIYAKALNTAGGASFEFWTALSGAQAGRTFDIVGGKTSPTPYVAVYNNIDADENATCRFRAWQGGRNGGQIEFGRENANSWESSNANADGYIAFAPVLNNVNTERMRIKSDGSVNIGLVEEVWTNNGVEFLPAGVVQSSRSSNYALRLNRNTDDGDIARFYRSGTVVGSISVTTTATAFNESSDYRLKENIVPLTGAADRLKQLKPSQFNFIADPGKTVDGFIAHEAQEVVPESVTGTKDEVEAIGTLTRWDGKVLETDVPEPESLTFDEEVIITPAVEAVPAEYDDDGNELTPAVHEVPAVTETVTRTNTWTKTGERPIYQGIDKSKLVPLLTAALQEALAKIETLEQRLNDAGIA